MGRAFGFLCAAAVALGLASVQLGCVRAQGVPSPGSGSTQTGVTNGSGQYGMYSNLDPTMAIVVVVTVCAFFVMGFFSVYIRHCSEESSAGGGGSRSAGAVLLVGAGGGGAYLRRGLDPGVVGSFPVLAYVAVKEHKVGKRALECAVCLAEFDDFDLLKILPKCEHAFHPECIDAWLASHVTCPVCRANQTPDPCPRHATAAAAAAAELAVDRRPVSQRHVEEEEEEEEGHPPRRQQQPPPRDEVQNEVRINIGGGDEDAGATATATAAAVKLPKSHSTGHLLARPGLGPDPDRYALRLPEEVRRQIRMVASAKAGVRRSTSYDVLLAAIEGGSRKGGGRLFAAATPSAAAERIYVGDGMDGGDREFEVGEQSLSRLPV